MDSISNDHVDIDMLKTGNITFSKTPSVYQKDEYYRIEERKYGANLHEIKYQIYKDLHIELHFRSQHCPLGTHL